MLPHRRHFIWKPEEGSPVEKKHAELGRLYDSHSITVEVKPEGKEMSRRSFVKEVWK
jgi:hypothetical protein